MRELRITGLLLLAVYIVAPLAVRGAEAPSPAPAAAQAEPPSDDQAVTELKEHHRHHHHGGIVQFVAMSLDTLGADDAKRAQVEKLQTDLRSQMVPAREAEKELLGILGDGVAAGNVDTAKVDAGIAKLASAAEAVHGASLETMNKLHGILSPAERVALVDKVQAHWEVWRQVNHEEEASGQGHAGRLGRLTEELSLTPEQTGKISKALHAAGGGAHKFDPAKGEASVKAFCDAFAGDKFDAKSVASNAAGHLASHGATRMAVFYETVTPILTAPQRTKLAARLHEHAGYPAAASGK